MAATEAVAKKNIFKRIGGAIAGFFGGIAAELKKVTWPTKKELFKSTLAVLVVCVVIGAIIFGLDALLDYLLKLIRNIKPL